MAIRAKPARLNGNRGDLGFEADLFKAADKLRGNMEPSDYKNVALSLIFLKHISGSFETKRAELLSHYPEVPKMASPGPYGAAPWFPGRTRLLSHTNSAQLLFGQALTVRVPRKVTGRGQHRSGPRDL